MNLISNYRKDLIEALSIFVILLMDHELARGKTPAGAALAARENIDAIVDGAIAEAEKHAE
jgi:hypothetical protein